MTYKELKNTEEFKKARKIILLNQKLDRIDTTKMTENELEELEVNACLESDDKDTLKVSLICLEEYLVEVTETLQHSWVVRAASREDAIERIEAALRKDIIRIDGIDDFTGREIEIKDEPVTKWHDRYLVD